MAIAKQRSLGNRWCDLGWMEMAPERGKTVVNLDAGDVAPAPHGWHAFDDAREFGKAL